MAEGLDIRLSTAVTKICHDQAGVRVETTDPRTTVTATFEGEILGCQEDAVCGRDGDRGGGGRVASRLHDLAERVGSVRCPLSDHGSAECLCS